MRSFAVEPSISSRPIPFIILLCSSSLRELRSCFRKDFCLGVGFDLLSSKAAVCASEKPPTKLDQTSGASILPCSIPSKLASMPAVNSDSKTPLLPSLPYMGAISSQRRIPRSVGIRDPFSLTTYLLLSSSSLSTVDAYVDGLPIPLFCILSTRVCCLSLLGGFVSSTIRRGLSLFIRIWMLLPTVVPVFGGFRFGVAL